MVLTLNEEATIGKCLDSIADQDFSKGGVEIIVVDGESTDGTREIAERYTSKILVESRHTFGYARNLGVHSAEGRYVAFMSADAWAEPDWLRNIHRRLSSGGLEGVVGRQLPIVSSDWVSKIRGAGFKRAYPDEARHMGNGDNFSTVNCTYVRETILENGGFDEVLPACEDQDLAHKMLQADVKIVYDPDVTVHHVAEDSLMEIVRKTFRQGIGEGVCNSRYKVWTGRLFLSVLLVLMLAGVPLALLIGFPLSSIGIVLGSLIVLSFAALTGQAVEIFRATKDWRTLLGTYIYYPSVAAAELLGFLIGRLTAQKFPTVKDTQT